MNACGTGGRRRAGVPNERMPLRRRLDAGAGVRRDAAVVQRRRTASCASVACVERDPSAQHDACARRSCAPMPTAWKSPSGERKIARTPMSSPRHRHRQRESAARRAAPSCAGPTAAPVRRRRERRRASAVRSRGRQPPIPASDAGRQPEERERRPRRDVPGQPEHLHRRRRVARQLRAVQDRDELRRSPPSSTNGAGTA